MKENFIIVVHNIRSAFNVGSIFRTADAAGADGIILSGYSAVPPHPRLLKVSLGAENTIPWEKCREIWRRINEYRKLKYQIIALENNVSGRDIFSFKPAPPIVLILGNEKTGLSEKILRRCDEVLYIPMRGRKESLNVSVAFGIAAYYLNNAIIIK